MSDIEQRLREAHPNSQQYASGSKILLEAADRIAELETMVKVFRGCIETGQFPQQGSRLHKMIYELVGENEE